MKNLFFFLFLISCSTPNSNYNVKNKTLDFNKDLTFNEFNILLIKYAEANTYPSIDK